MKTPLTEILNRVTPLPWRGRSEPTVAHYIESEDCKPVANRMNFEDSVYAVHACNNLPALVEALEQLLPEWHEESSDSTHANGHIAGEFTWADIRRIKAALKSAQQVEGV